MANTPPDPPVSALGKQLAEEAKIAAFRKTISEAKEAEAKADKQAFDNQKAIKDDQRGDLNGPEIKPLEGKVSAAGTYIETKLLANKLLNSLATKLVDKIFADMTINDNNCFVIYHTESIPLMEMCFALTFQLKAFEADLDAVVAANLKLLTPENASQHEHGGTTPLFIGLAASGILKTAADIFSLFRTDSTITNTELVKDETLVTGCFAEAFLKKKKGKLYYPSAFPVTLFSSVDTTPSLIGLYTQVKLKGSEVAVLQQQLDVRVSGIDSEVALVTDPIKLVQLQAKRLDFSAGSVQLAGVKAAFTQLESILFAIDQTTKSSLLSVLVHAEKLMELVSKENTYTIKLDTDLSGSSIVRQNFFLGTSLKHAGGARLSCLILERDGAIKFAYNALQYSEEMTSDKIKDLVNE